MSYYIVLYENAEDRLFEKAIKTYSLLYELSFNVLEHLFE